jgi:DNA-binding NarL/FixJ family response regulator
MKILIIDDHHLFREGLCHILRKQMRNVHILEASNCDLAEKLVLENADLDLLLLDLNIPIKNGFFRLESFTRNYPALPVVVLSDATQNRDIQRAVKAGAMGYIPKDTTSSANMVRALHHIHSGGIFIPPQSPAQRQLEAILNQVQSLTSRQLQVLSHLKQGDSNKQIATCLNIAEATIKMHVTAIIKGLGVKNRTQAVIEAKKQERNFSGILAIESI